MRRYRDDGSIEPSIMLTLSEFEDEMGGHIPEFVHEFYADREWNKDEQRTFAEWYKLFNEFHGVKETV